MDCRHNEMRNVAWCDGHAKAMKYDQLEGTAPNTENRKVAYIVGSASYWVRDPNITIFPMWQTAQSLNHF